MWVDRKETTYSSPDTCRLNCVFLLLLAGVYSNPRPRRTLNPVNFATFPAALTSSAADLPVDMTACRCVVKPGGDWQSGEWSSCLLAYVRSEAH